MSAHTVGHADVLFSHAPDDVLSHIVIALAPVDVNVSVADASFKPEVFHVAAVTLHHECLLSTGRLWAPEEPHSC